MLVEVDVDPDDIISEMEIDEVLDQFDDDDIADYLSEGFVMTHFNLIDGDTHDEVCQELDRITGEFESYRQENEVME